MENIFLCVKDEDGELRPMAGIWRDNEAGRISAYEYGRKYNIEIVKIEIKEIKE